MRSGSCLCGAVTLTVAGSLPNPNFCHCRMCRKHSGHYFASTDVPRTALTIGAFDGATETAANLPIYVADTGDYYEIAGGLPQYDTVPPRD